MEFGLHHLLIIIVIIFGSMLFISTHYFNYDKTCLEEKATDYCFQHNMEFDELDRGEFWRNYFTCKKDLRIDGENRFLFLDSEMKECKK